MVRVYIWSVEALIILGLTVMVGLTFASTVIRFLPGFGGIYWAEEITRYVSIWVVFLAGGLGVRYGIHLNLDLLFAAVPRSVGRLLLLFAFALMLIFEFVLVYYGIKMTIMNHAQQSTSLRFPMSYAYAAVPVGGFIMFCETVRLIVLVLRRKELFEERVAV